MVMVDECSALEVSHRSRGRNSGPERRFEVARQQLNKPLLVLSPHLRPASPRLGSHCSSSVHEYIRSSSLIMASSVFYRFASRKDESRVTFDGTGISIFDLKREIILANNMSKANDFDLYVFNPATQEGAWHYPIPRREPNQSRRVRRRHDDHSSVFISHCEAKTCSATRQGQGRILHCWRGGQLASL